MKAQNLLRVSHRAKQLRLNNAHKNFYHQAAGYLQDIFLKTRNRLQHTRSSQWNFNVPNIKGIESNTFYFNAIKDWNSLPNNLKKLWEHTHLQKGSKEVPVTNGNRGSREGVSLPIGHTCTANKPRLNIAAFHKKGPIGNRPGQPSWVILGRNQIMLQ